ncbi:hypothetical protein PIB30_080558, partial [Stylosanthes scabra]|nr:hypothetical protein [Stylosanthes scabra]
SSCLVTITTTQTPISIAVVLLRVPLHHAVVITQWWICDGGRMVLPEKKGRDGKKEEEV